MPPRKRGVAKAGNNIARIAGISAPGAHTAASSSSAAAAAAVYTSIGAGGAERSMKRAREQLSEVDDEDITLDILGQRSLVSAVDSTLLLKTPSQSKHHAESSTCIALTDVCTPQRQVAESTSSPAVRETFLHDWSGSSRSKRESFPLGASCSRELAPLNSSTERHYEYILSGSSSRSGSSSSSIDRNNTAVITKENTRLFQVSERGALEDGTITLSPGERSSTVLVRRAAASRPTPSPATLWIYLEDDDEEEEVAASSPQSSPKPARTNNESRSCKAVGDSVPSFVVQMPTAFQRSQSLRREPIADVLPPTFRARKAPLQGGKPSPKAPHALTNGFAIYDDDATSSGEKEREELSAYGSSKSIAAPSTCPSTARPLAPLVNLGGTTCVSSASPATLQCSGDVTYIQDDDCTSASSDAQSSSRAAPQEPADAKEFKKLNSSSEPSKPVPPPSVIAQHASIASDKVNEPCQTPSVRDFIFSSCRRLSGDFGDTTFKSLAEATVLTSAADLTAKSSTKSSSGSGPLPEVARPVDALRSVFPSHFSRKGFLSAAESVVSKPHCLGPGEFWKAFESAEYVGEGSFGLVWRCRTVDGDLVAVKSCPLSLQSRWSIDDAYSVLREIAIMRFLSEHNVPYVLPLCSAFFVQGRETLPPDVVAALKWKVKMEKKLKQEQKGGGKKKKEDATESSIVVEETAEQIAERERHEKVRLPRFLSISVNDALLCDATAFLVTELCDGDLESIERHDGIAKGVAFCVSTALASMHILGLVHLDLKPSNILFTYENGPSQRREPPPKEQQVESSSGVTLTRPVQHDSMRPPAASGFSSIKFYLSDFGNCRIVGPDPHGEVSDVVGTYEYMDIRALRDEVCSRATDCFSLGATLYELMFSKRLYPPCTNPRCKTEEDHTRHCYVAAAQQPVVIESPAPSSSATVLLLQKLTTGLLARDPKERWTAERCRAFILQNGIAGAAPQS